ncbi:MAG: hypothetical protein ACTSWQ_02120 [Candidatus Thorarchaeota archaeon]
MAEILKVAHDIETSGFSKVSKEIRDSLVLGTLFHNADSREKQVCELTGARLGVPVVDLSWRNVELKETSALLDEIRMASDVADLLLTAFSSSETFSEGRKLTSKFPTSSDVPLINLHDDIYNWQTALSHMLGFQNRIGDLSGKQVVVSWGFGSNFTNPAIAHSLMVSSALAGADVRVVAPPDFPTLGRVRKEASQSAVSVEATSDFANAFKDADAVYVLNWFRLNDFNHPERNTEQASKYKDWYLTEDLLPDSCILSTDSSIQSDITVSAELLHDPRCINSSWLSRRVQILAATIDYVLRESSGSGIHSIT